MASVRPAKPLYVARAFDIDGLILNPDYYSSPELHGDIEKCNPEFFAWLRQENTRRGLTEKNSCVLIASTRQSKEVDLLNIAYKDNLCSVHNLPGKGASAFTVIDDIAERLNTTVNTMLLVDIYNKLPMGTAYRFAKTLTDFDDAHPKLTETLGLEKDKTKIAYAHIQQLSLENPGHQIIYQFFDDREDVIATLQAYFQTNRHLIPGNVSIELYRYEKNDGKITFFKCPTILSSNPPEAPANKNYADDMRRGKLRKIDGIQGKMLNPTEIKLQLPTLRNPASFYSQPTNPTSGKSMRTAPAPGF